MDTERWTCTEAGEQKASGGKRVDKEKQREAWGGFRVPRTLCPFVCAVLPLSVRVEGVLLPLLATELAEALGMIMS